MPKALWWTKAVLFITAAILIFIFHEEVMPYAAFLVGGVILAYAVEELGFLIARKKYADMAAGLIEIMLAVLLFIVHDNILSICVIWGVWSVIREGREMTHAIAHFRKQRLALLNIAESVVVIVLSCMMILEPGHHHAHIHVILLGIELLLEIAFPLAEKGIMRALPRRPETDPSEEKSEEE